MKSYPTPWQKKVIWASLTGLAVAAIGALAIFVILTIAKALGFLQPILIPIAVAGILAYLLNPVVNKAVQWGMKRNFALLAVFALVFLALIGIGLWVIPQIYHQSLAFGKEVPEMVAKAKVAIAKLQEHYNLHGDNPYVSQATEWIQAQIPLLPPKIWAFLGGGLQGFLGAFGFLLGLIVVPIYLYFFLSNAGAISQHWGDYIPLRASSFKDEVVDCLSEINSYLIAFFRGQIIVTTIDGILLAIGLLILGLPFALLIGIAVAILQLVPYLGVVLCWIPAFLIALAHFPDWSGPIWVTVLFIAVTNLDGLIIAPRVVGDSVGLHPMTIIVSVFAWSLLIGGLLGALLAVPLTATLKVLLRRYVWQRQFNAPPSEPPAEPLPSTSL
jgi:predicted PurR-regulated permease PerM